MFDYLQKFNNLEKDLRDKVSTRTVMTAIDELEKKYGVYLAAVVMKVMIKEIAINSLARYFVSEFNLSGTVAEQLVKELRSKVFFGVNDYLEITPASLHGPEKRDVAKEPFKKDRDEKTIQETGAAPASPGANFFFSPEDEKEIRELSKKIDGSEKFSLHDDSINERLNKITKEAQINFSSEFLANRFKQIITIYLRGVRNRIETKQTLIKPFAGGGLGFDDESAEKVLKIAENSEVELNRSNIGPPTKIKLPEEIAISKESEDRFSKHKKIGIRDFDYDLKSTLLAKAEDLTVNPEKEEKVSVKKLDIEHELAPPPPVSYQEGLPQITPAASIILQKRKSKSQPKIDVLTKEAARPVSGPKTQPRRPIEAGGKKRMEDVVYIPKVMSSIDELFYMDLVNFRRLSQDSSEIKEKLIEKINLLEEEKYSKRIEGIKAWRQSPVNKLYLKIGQQSISEHKPVDIVIEERKRAGQEYLSKDEFKAVMDLNRELRF